MDFNAGHGYLLIGGLILVGAGLLILSLIVNLHVAHSVRDDVTAIRSTSATATNATRGANA
ncbi:hypothetical protein [Mesorhizobium sp. WSM4884]|uniref:hypothetical protein n=1 Tax=Mesorhizobium sp. WSM4884 TaxID=3038542 RepID=UPI00241741D9|nr:hypothetical protein [Mesorhizobium sp. WSM4884]MDG4884180.1 hypothetical protein [Mesorhizobium sp. WSM4884]